MSPKIKKPATPSEEELALFHETMKGTKRLVYHKTSLTQVDHLPLRLPAPISVTIKATLTDIAGLSPVTANEYLSFKHPSIPDKTLRKLRKGKYNVDAMLDLHGMTVDEAENAVNAFLAQCVQRELRIVLIIHGKGSHSEAPILKNKLNHWLRSYNIVLAFCSASPRHGGSGASYVLLKHQRGLV